MASQAVQRQEITFSMSPDGMARTQQLLSRCGHSNLNLLLARGLALVEFVLDQQELGRAVGSVILGEDEFLPLREREELVTPGKARPKPTAVPCAAPSASAEAPINPKLVPRARVPVESPPLTNEPRARRLFKHAAFAVNDDAGPVRSLAYHQERSDSMGIDAPISANGHALPGGLAVHHLAELQAAMDEHAMATHFLLCPATDEISYYGFFPNSGWHRLSGQTKTWALDPAAQRGELSVFPLDIAAFYLRRVEASQADRSTPDV
ncbi:hypothetical protein [Pseudomonas gingeri]|uniref:hypothetical protein n=1 Tax=Pseudomonas gingeri TaxID=117681 RepID=UPI0015A26A77|nr:hypothetical protein [Pseudomonas gingeri]NWA11980.1 hypothetical protein [Pseudomonas gingeri]